VFDSIIPSPVFSKDVLISIELIRKAAAELRDVTGFLSTFGPLEADIPLIKKSVNDVIAGTDRTLADLFDLTEWAQNLEGKITQSESPSFAPSGSFRPSDLPSYSPSYTPSYHPTESVRPSDDVSFQYR
jgi:hypothetical protein